MASAPIETPETRRGEDALSPPVDADTTQAGDTDTRQIRVRRREVRIIAAARAVFLEHGYSGATMAMIARAAGVADGTLYTYFANKDALARAVIADFYERLTTSAQSGVDAKTTARDKLAWLARHHLTQVTSERGVVEMLPLLMAAPEDYAGSALYEMNRRYVAVFDRILADAQHNGEIDASRTPWVVRDIFFGSLDYGVKTMTFKGRGKSKAKLVNDLVDMICSGDRDRETIADRLEAAVARLESSVGTKP